jgi:exodeoxyribonuclease V gamma subunit
MGSFHLHRSNRVERLVAELATQLETPLGGPFDPEAVVVPGHGMGVWLSMELSRRLGVWATPLLYPRGLIDRVVKGVLGERALGPEPLSEKVLEWAVRATLPSLLPEPEFARLSRYLTDDAGGVRLAQLSARIATVFDQYLMYRPDWVRSWEGGGTAGIPDEERWQVTLFRRVTERFSGRHVAELEDALLTRLADDRTPAGLPPRVSVFGLSTLPPLFVRVIVALSRHIDVHVFQFAVSPDLGSDLDRTRPLLASHGRVGRELDLVFTTTLETQGIDPVLHDAFERPNGDGLLQALQRQWFDPSATNPAEHPLESSTSSLSIHACHGPMREVEVLHDQLLSLLTRAQNPVAPEEVLVLVPDLETYAPLIEAVFRRDSNDPRFLPFRISDRQSRRDAPIFDAFLRVLGMVGGRVTAAEVIDLFQLDSVQDRLGLEANDADRIKEWIVASGVRWGMDAEHRGKHGLPADSANTWRFGLSRLLLGYAMPGDERRTFGGLVAYDDVEGKDAELLGVLAAFLRTLFGWLRDLERPRPLAGFTTALGELMAALFGEDPESLHQIGAIRRALEELTRISTAAGFEEEIDIAVVRWLVEREVDGLAPERGFLAGGITFCSMVPMRSIPFRVIALLGMNDGVFPRAPRPIEFDLVRNGKTARREADRSPRDDDRYLFLETVCAAREALIVTYAGRSLRDSRELPASVSVSELLDCVCGPDLGREKRRERLVVPHRLQGFSPVYFDGSDGRLFSHSEEYQRAALRRQRSRSEAAPFLERLGPVPREGTIALEDLVRFWRSPPAFLLNRRLGIYLRHEKVDLRSREPLELDALDQWRIGDPLVLHRLEQLDVSTSERVFRGKGELPLGVFGRALLDKVARDAGAIADQTRRLRNGDELPPLELDVPLANGMRLRGSLGGRFPGGFIEQSYSAPSAKRLLSLWLRHLAAAAMSGEQEASLLIEREKSESRKSDKKKGHLFVSIRELSPVSRQEALTQLNQLVFYFLEGQSRALPFLPNPSYAYAETLEKGKPPREAVNKAMSAYGGDRDASFDPHSELLFDQRLPPFDAKFDAGEQGPEETEFHRLSLLVFSPLFAACQEHRG